ncbi:MAG: hypothetical protein C0501_31170 [Isosphaera sp.]|nr:hypothetical protein [Isosphaera sp.]
MLRLACAAALAAGFLGLSSAAGGQKEKDKESKLTFEIYKGGKGEYRWRLKSAANNQILATAGQGYKDKADARNSIALLQKVGTDDKLTLELYEDEKKEHRWRLKAANNQVVASSSEGYKNKADAEKAVALIKAHGAKAEVVEIKE